MHPPEALLDHPGAVFLSGYDADLYNDALAGWERFDILGYSSTGYRREVLWMNEKAATGARAAERAAARRTPTGAMGMMYSPPAESPETEPPAVAAVFGALIEGWHSRGEE